ncbi:DoxX family protein [Candidatus Peregrinibacteria bacterium]|nr:DoxX family protein [Candidatus Peregrinibacteria bacterium]MBI3816004.1 DoxX family protein [Candidatus Peregrinibacteria bacterium]
MQRFFATNHDYGTLLLRVGAGAAMLPFGILKLQTFTGTMQFLTSQGIPSFIAFLVILGESVGALSMIVGFCTRFCAASLAVIMIGAVAATYGSGYMTGFVIPLLFLFMFLPLIVHGGGAWSADEAIAKKIV